MWDPDGTGLDTLIALTMKIVMVVEMVAVACRSLQHCVLLLFF
jgi:hypothetical protein